MLNINYDMSTKDKTISMWRAGNQAATWHMMSLDSGDVFRYSKDSIIIDYAPFEEKGVYYIPLGEITRIVGYSINWDEVNGAYVLSDK